MVCITYQYVVCMHPIYVLILCMHPIMVHVYMGYAILQTSVYIHLLKES